MWRVDITLFLDKLTTLVPSGLIVDGEPVRFVDNVVAYGSRIFFSQVSSRWNVSEPFMPLVEYENTGR